jgi:hypothetical protein
MEEPHDLPAMSLMDSVDASMHDAPAVVSAHRIVKSNHPVG